MEAVNFTARPLYKVTIIGLLILHSGHKVGSFRGTLLKHTKDIFIYVTNFHKDKIVKI